MKFILFLTTVPAIWLTSLAVQAQTSVPTFGGVSNSNSSSEQFFRQGRDELYFLQEDEAVLEIDEEISEETQNSEDIENQAESTESTESEQSK